ncbi:DNA-binding protein [Pedobacter psychrodurus]|uniref:DNA-binding protein n=1 Tax=Pedobacter psychrodurus TaxID=2530456 RepID=A0A4R0Q5B6_9SPHI|nr:helix-turn-helix domain-containing protein [Pedobacter psychrodurus]TCD27787.1 DNA-binding protein [Pedobacter psychrodurus]
MKMDIITKADLQEFKLEMLNEIRGMLQGSTNAQNRSWLRSKDVRKMLNISPGTLQNLRINGVLPFHKVGGTIFYSRESVEKMIEGS